MRPGKALTFLAVYNVVQNTMLRERGYVVGNLIATGVGLSWARSSGLEWPDLGMDRVKAPAGLGLGIGVAMVASTFAISRRDGAWVRAMLDDERLEDVADREAWYRLLVRFPLGTALFEEVWFRGVLPASLRQHGSARPELVANAAFAVWHLIPTAHAISANRNESSLSPGRRAGLVVGGSVVAGIAGLGFAALRQVSSSLSAPWLAHAAFNGLSFWVGLKHQRAARPA